MIRVKSYTTYSNEWMSMLIGHSVVAADEVLGEITLGDGTSVRFEQISDLMLVTFIDNNMREV